MNVLQRRSGVRLAAMALMAVALGARGPLSAEERRGEALADACTSCHGIGGRSHGYIPSLNTASKDALVRDLKAYRAQIKPASIMNRIARAYSDADIDALADYFSSGAKP
jgi:sulfide dehydrogenase cytochrome subunit